MGTLDPLGTEPEPQREGVDSETPCVEGVGNGRVCLAHQLIGGLGSVVSSPSRVRGRAPVEI